METASLILYILVCVWAVVNLFISAHLFQHHVADSPVCSCGNPYEDPFHFFSACLRYTAQRDMMVNSICAITPCTIRTILYGCEACSIEENKLVFDYVRFYIKSTNRF